MAFYAKRKLLVFVKYTGWFKSFESFSQFLQDFKIWEAFNK